ncbi:TonB-dependent receptor [Wenyingzhuangia sp. chi5]|uniref:TonB-dependent receptor n=1 Tax=Wenyingzhuangia gilva TaxID=3057677 RepID=A0ABT8VRZ8_9FLAO|nr:TonB-dependent receptor [Wenyingzhuangia sp. chi5]MDO3694744.1 TonB-dependent receptor [Wenyingzhuangia sp. chi5]
MISFKTRILFTFHLLSSIVCYSQSKNSEKTITEGNTSELNEVVISVRNNAKKNKQIASTIDTISSKELERANNTNFAPVLNRIPGIFMQSGSLNTNRITIRGIGARNLYGTAKIRAYYKDIPLTNGSGETNIEDFELASIGAIYIIKGTSALKYGAGLGGVIQIKPHESNGNQSSIFNQLTIGSFGLSKGIFKVNYSTKKNNIQTIYSDTHSNGYRENNEYNRQTFTVSTNHYFGKNDELSLLSSFVDLKAFIPSSINQNDYKNNPKKAAFTWKQAKGYEDVIRGLLGLSWKHQYNNNLIQTTSVFSSFKEAYEPRPFDILKEKTHAIGIRTKLLGNLKLWNSNLDYTLGGEFFKDTYQYQNYQNLYQDYPSGTGSVQGNELSNFKEKRNYYNLFLESNYQLSLKTTLSVGLNLNKTAYNLKDNFAFSSSNPDQSGNFKFKNILSPKFGISYNPLKNIRLYTSINHGFSPITLAETLLPDGQINNNLKPETGWNYEIGTRGEMLSNRLQFGLALYSLNIKNLLVAKRTAQDQYIGVNAGKTQHNGLELTLNYYWLKNKKLSISSFTNYTLNHFTFKKFIDDNKDYSENDLTGVPSDVFNTGVDFNSNIGIHGNLNYQYVGSMPITDSNSLYSDSYRLTNLKLGYTISLFKKLDLDTFIGINNIFNKAYASQILINASGFGNSAPRYYYPGNPLNYYTGINLKYLF